MKSGIIVNFINAVVKYESLFFFNTMPNIYEMTRISNLSNNTYKFHQFTKEKDKCYEMI